MKSNSLLIVISVTILFISACSRKEQVIETLPIPVIQVVQKDTIVFRDYVAEINARRNVELRARVQGYLDKIYVDEGQSIKKGQILFQINSEEYQASLSQAKANLRSLLAEAAAREVEVNRVKMLVQKNVVSETELSLAMSELASANAKIEEAKSDVSKAEIRLSHTAIVAPFDGQISMLPYKMGSLIDEGTLLTTVSDVELVYAYFRVSEPEYLEFKYNRSRKQEGPGQAQLILADGSLHEHPGFVEPIEAEFETTTGTIPFRAIFPNPDGLLRHGSTGKVRLPIKQKDAVIVPQKSTFEIQDRTYVYVVNDNNTISMRGFKPLTRLSKYYIVESGLKPGDRIVYEGIQGLKDGMKIAPKELSAIALMQSDSEMIKASLND